MAAMTKLLSRLLPLVALFLAACASQPKPAPVAASAPAAPAANDNADPALWVVKDADTTIYLFGTIHVLKPGLTWFDEAVKTAFDSAGELRLEMVMPEEAPTREAALKVATLPEGQTLSSKLPPETQAKMTATLAGYGLPGNAFDRYTPWFAANNLTILPLMKLGYKLDAGAEQILTASAKESGKPVTGFETFGEQLGFFASLSDNAQVEFLTSVVNDLPKMGETVDSMVADWAKGDPDALAKLLNDDLDANRELGEVLLTRRNARWADWIKGRMDQPGTVFIAVGAGHLAGENSVQTMLAQRGLKAERVKY